MFAERNNQDINKGRGGALRSYFYIRKYLVTKEEDWIDVIIIIVIGQENHKQAVVLLYLPSAPIIS